VNRPRLASATPGGSEALTLSPLGEEVRACLMRTPRMLPSRFLYDALGSALFDAICELPWYRVTRAEMRLLTAHAADVWQAMSPLDCIVELGSGDGRKLAALLSKQPRGGAPVRIDLVDISASALESAARALAGMGAVDVVKHLATYEAGLKSATGPAARGRALVLFLGSNLGNFDPPSAEAMLRRIRASLRPGDALLLGVDLVKPERDLLLAYDDPLGVTAAFNRNLLVRLNRELDADFDPAAFAHRAVWNAQHARVEMHLVSTGRQVVRISGARLVLDLQPSESIWTESSYKYDRGDVVRMIERAGFAATAQWVDAPAGFALTLCGVPPGRA
jgi:dimethylhistidine N-methyltransferase